MTDIASTLNERVTLQTPVLADDGYGGKTVSWTDVATVFADVKPVYTNWNEQEVAGRPEARASYRVVLRKRTDITGATRIIWKTHVLNIQSLHEAGELTSMLTYEEGL